MAAAIEPSRVPKSSGSAPCRRERRKSQNPTAYGPRLDQHVLVHELFQLDRHSRRRRQAVLHAQPRNGRPEVTRLLANQSLEVRERSLGVPAQRSRQPAVVERLGIVGVQAQSLLAVDQRGLVVPEPAVRDSAQQPPPRSARLELDDSIAVGNRAGQVDDPEAQPGPTVQGLGVVRAHRDRLIEVGERLRQIAQVAAQVATRHQRSDVARVDLDGPVEILARPVEVPEALLDGAAVEVSDRVRRL